MQHFQADVIVAGAGPAGATVARLLAHKGRKVLVVDPETHVTDRLELLPPAAQGIVAALDLCEIVEDWRISRPCFGIRRNWGQVELEYDDFLHHRGGIGFVVDRAHFDSRLRQGAKDAGVEFLRGRVHSVRRELCGLEISVETQEEFIQVASTAAVDATGRSSLLARRLGARRERDESLVAHLESRTAYVAPSHSPDWLEAWGEDDKWRYRISGPGGRLETWAISPPEHASRSGPGPRVDASSCRLSNAGGENWLAIGDAVMSFDPVTSQGLFNALSTALIAAGAFLSPQSFNGNTARVYSIAVAETFRHSEMGRAIVYRALAGIPHTEVW